MADHRFHLPDMSCAHCSASVTRALRELDEQARIEIDLPARQLRVESERSREQLAAALDAAGYEPAPA